ncbi:hypothetical protein SDC9_105815 [bioreactor metagenome]|uniref:SLH domain-containing protein n=1 Tax=bioreactor metagenome TaxID=1076179 RepID=A0A645B0P2_9ZZZZ
MFTLLYRTLFFLEKLPEEETTGGLDDFKDADGISDYAKEAVNTMIKAKIISGSGGMLDPMGESTRAQMAQVLYNLLSK